MKGFFRDGWRSGRDSNPTERPERSSDGPQRHGIRGLGRRFAPRLTARVNQTGQPLVLALVLLGGCAEVPRAELAWQLTHAVDVAQTVQIARSSCYHESDELTSRMIGENPSVGEALAWGVGLAGVHYGVTRWLESIDAPRWLQGGWQALTIGNTAYFVKQNNDQGIKPWDTDC